VSLLWKGFCALIEIGKGVGMNQNELNEILEQHQLWLEDNSKGNRADLSRADLFRADLFRANLSYANLSGVNLSEANLYKVNLHKANLPFANLYKANLYKANLSESSLPNANLFRADLSNADLYKANLSFANLYKANLYRANLSVSNTQHTKGILSFTGEKYTLVYYRYEDQYRVKIGCIDHSIQHWLDNYQYIGETNGFNEDEMELYLTMIKTFSQYEIV
jgi:hypothetical protein